MQLSEKEREEMVEYRTRASQREAVRRTKQKHPKEKQIQNQILSPLSTLMATKVLDSPKPLQHHDSPSPKADVGKGFTPPEMTNLTPGESSEPFILTYKKSTTPLEAQMREKATEIKQIQEETEAGMCLQSLLKKSREFIEKEQGLKVTKTVSEMPPESVGCLQNRTGSGLLFYSPKKSPETINATLSPRVYHERPRPVSAGSLFFSYTEKPKPRPKDLKTEQNSTHFNETFRRLELSPVDPLFRRRCHTLDSHASSSRPIIDRSQERMPRFMAGVTAKTPPRLSPPSPVSKSFSRESPGSGLRGSAVTPDSPSRAKVCSYRSCKSGANLASNERRAEEFSQQVHSLEDMQRSLEEENYAFWMSSLIAEYERGQLQPSPDVEERLRRWGVLGAPSPSPGLDRDERYPVLSPKLSPGDRRYQGQSLGSSSEAASPSLQTPVYTRGFGKSRNRQSQVLSEEQQRALCRLGATAKGFLTRRLLITDKVKNLRQTVQESVLVFAWNPQDTQEFLGSLGADAPQRRPSLSQQDRTLQERVRAQLRAALLDVHDIFFSLTLEERLMLIQQDRELQTERRLREMYNSIIFIKVLYIRSSNAISSQMFLCFIRVGESPGKSRKAQKPKSPSVKRVLLPSQGQNAPVPGQQVSRSSRKTPEQRVQHSERLKKRNSLG
ncbi:hypothetical protein DNTS_020618 [Danionella cerebrum]|uniref:Uncharacterized protein n=1 Tax=Danionella cerebrum TaxID=2873325 RepID=A0A553R593_9TELE|nr:hypothetical protein DNTS_020618 [Danionella translucida]